MLNYESLGLFLALKNTPNKCYLSVDLIYCISAIVSNDDFNSNFVFSYLIQNLSLHKVQFFAPKKRFFTKMFSGVIGHIDSLMLKVFILSWEANFLIFLGKIKIKVYCV